MNGMLRRILFSRLFILIGSFAIAIIVLEVGLRCYYYQRHGPFQSALFHALHRSVKGYSLFGLSGQRLNQAAWEASYTERGLAVPTQGPREGYWGSRINPKVYDKELLMIREKEQFIPELVAIDNLGLQHVGEERNPLPHILIVGGSVAFGSYASSIENTYFAKLLALSKLEFPAIKISVLARGGSVSEDDYALFVLRGLEVKPAVVLFLNGLNDLMLTNQKETDLKHHARVYLRNMKVAQRVALDHGLTCILAPQPFLGYKKIKTPLERRILTLSGLDYENVVNPSYDSIREGLKQLADEQMNTFFLDCSGVCDDERATTFADQWHFSDSGHELLARKLLIELQPILKKVLAKSKSANDENHDGNLLRRVNRGS